MSGILEEGLGMIVVSWKEGELTKAEGAALMGSWDCSHTR